MTVDEISTVDRPAQSGATVAIMKSEGAALRKNAAEVASGEAEPLFKAADYSDAIMVRAGELALSEGGTPGEALLKHCGTDPELVELGIAERMAEAHRNRARSDRAYEVAGWER